MKICIDDKIPYIRGVFEEYASVEYLPGGVLPPGKHCDADALIIRTRTLCNAATLQNCPQLRFIATATIGYDHIDTAYCQSHGISWTNAPGCNADSVAMYIMAALGELARRHGFALEERCLGIVGVGEVGGRVAALARSRGCRVLENDPFKQAVHPSYVSLEEIIARADIITLHPWLSHEGPHATWHLFDRERLYRLKAHQILINASRGEVVDNTALKEVLQARRIQAAVLDVWEHEPHIDTELLPLLDIATPHIAGYSIDGKANGTRMSVQAVARYFGLEPLYQWKVEGLPRCTPVYNILLDDAALRLHPADFESLRPQAAITRVLSKL